MTLRLCALLICVLAMPATADVPIPGAQAPASAPDLATELAGAQRDYAQFVAANKYAAALQSAERAYQLGLKIYGPQDKITASLAFNRAVALLKAGRAPEALASLDAVVPLYQQIYGKDAAETIDPLMARGDATPRSDPKQQRSNYDRAIAIARSQEHANDSVMVQLNLQAGRHLLDSGSAESKRYFDVAYKLTKRQVRPTDESVAAAFWLGKYYLAAAKPGAAETYFIETITTAEEPGQPLNPLSLKARAELVDIFTQRHDTASATEQCLAVGRLQNISSKVDIHPLYRTDPIYPAAALAKEEGGWARLEFTIDATGTVQDARVLDSQGNAAFGDAALNAIKQWRYAPRFVDGSPVATPGVQAVLKFDVEQ